MIFRKNKPRDRSSKDPQVLRSRVPESGSSPLARRLRQDDEPDTIDLAAAPGFQAAEELDEPDTRTSEPRPDAEPQSPLISVDPATGKFYVHPGAPGQTVLLCGDVVESPTELRRGDLIRISDAEFEFRGLVERD
jgi:hypothetical protein